MADRWDIERESSRRPDGGGVWHRVAWAEDDVLGANLFLQACARSASSMRLVRRAAELVGDAYDVVAERVEP